MCVTPFRGEGFRRKRVVRMSMVVWRCVLVEKAIKTNLGDTEDCWKNRRVIARYVRTYGLFSKF